MRKVFVVLAAFLVAMGLTAPANAATVRVSRDVFHSYVQDSLSSCGSNWDNPSDNKYVPPAPPASVKTQVANDDVSGFVNITPDHVTGNGLPINVWRASSPDVVYIQVNGMSVQTNHWEYRYHAWVPNFNNSGCSVWTKLVYVD